MLETTTGGTLSVTGKISEGSPEPCTSSEPLIMDILIAFVVKQTLGIPILHFVGIHKCEHVFELFYGFLV
ncbi:hypothetical protein Y032_0413g1007 [Ancylostoma ceylanicum]|uniref:Uncharacterized protein n=1 Tax=Ancylostoma ceylanicum TaxID=53326 RepID=A0A016X227_9BILA|nr:hypothetical protein Y032_0413g1007 [Ancylostoma ceylanicum]